MILVEVSRPLAMCAASALARHRQALRQAHLSPPDGFDDLLDAMTRRAKVGHDRTDLASAAELVEYAPVAAPLLLTKAEAAEALGMSVRNLDRIVASGRLQAVRTGAASVRVRRSDLEAYVAELQPVSERQIAPAGRTHAHESGTHEHENGREPALQAGRAER